MTEPIRYLAVDRAERGGSKYERTFPDGTTRRGYDIYVTAQLADRDGLAHRAAPAEATNVGPRSEGPTERPAPLDLSGAPTAEDPA